MDFVNLLKETTFLPAIKNCILIAITLPSTTCSVEKSFKFESHIFKIVLLLITLVILFFIFISSLKRLKTWLRNTITQDRLNGLALMSIHNDILKNKKSMFIEKTIKLFCMEPRRVQFLFNND